jgi:hypothetical protein
MHSLFLHFYGIDNRLPFSVISVFQFAYFRIHLGVQISQARLQFGVAELTYLGTQVRVRVNVHNVAYK